MADDRSLETFPEEARSYIRELRSEAAQYRTERNQYREEATDLRTKYTEAGQLLKTANDQLNEFSAVKDTSEKTSAELARIQEEHDRLFAAAKYKLDPEDAKRLQGSNRDEWLADAEEFAGRLGTKPAGVAKNPGAAETPTEGGIEDPLLKAFKDAGL